MLHIHYIIYATQTQNHFCARIHTYIRTLSQCSAVQHASPSLLTGRMAQLCVCRGRTRDTFWCLRLMPCENYSYYNYTYTQSHNHTHSTNQLLLGTCIHMLQSVTHAHTSAPVHHLTGAWTSIARIRALPKDIKIHVTIKLCAYAYVCGLPRAAVAKIPIQTISFISARSGIRSWANIKVRY